MRTPGEIDAYYQGVKDGLWRYAWIRDGVYYVGTTGRTLEEAYNQVDLERKQALEECGERDGV